MGEAAVENAPAHDAIAVATAQGGLHARDALVRHALQQADVEAEPASKQMVVVSNKFNLGNDSIQLEGERLLVPLDGGALNSHKGKGDGRLPLLGAFEDEVVEGLADLVVLAVEGVGEVVGHGMVLRVVLELLGDSGVAKEEAEGGQNVLARRRKGLWRREVGGHVGHC